MCIYIELSSLDTPAKVAPLFVGCDYLLSCFWLFLLYRFPKKLTYKSPISTVSPKWSQGRDEIKSNSVDPFETCHLTWTKETSAPSWSQTWEGISLVSVWWPGLDPWGPDWHSQKKLHGTAAMWGSPPAERGISVGCHASWAADKVRDLCGLIPGFED